MIIIVQYLLLLYQPICFLDSCCCLESFCCWSERHGFYCCCSPLAVTLCISSTNISGCSCINLSLPRPKSQLFMMMEAIINPINQQQHTPYTKPSFLLVKDQTRRRGTMKSTPILGSQYQKNNMAGCRSESVIATPSTRLYCMLLYYTPSSGTIGHNVC